MAIGIRLERCHGCANIVLPAPLASVCPEIVLRRKTVVFFGKNLLEDRTFLEFAR